MFIANAAKLLSKKKYFCVSRVSVVTALYAILLYERSIINEIRLSRFILNESIALSIIPLDWQGGQ